MDLSMDTDVTRTVLNCIRERAHTTRESEPDDCGSLGAMLPSGCGINRSLYTDRGAVDSSPPVAENESRKLTESAMEFAMNRRVVRLITPTKRFFLRVEC